jgi:hypothetical protein
MVDEENFNDNKDEEGKKETRKQTKLEYDGTQDDRALSALLLLKQRTMLRSDKKAKVLTAKSRSLILSRNSKIQKMNDYKK